MGFLLDLWIPYARMVWLRVSARLWIASENIEWDPVQTQARSLTKKFEVLMAMAPSTTVPDSPVIPLSDSLLRSLEKRVRGQNTNKNNPNLRCFTSTV